MKKVIKPNLYGSYAKLKEGKMEYEVFSSRGFKIGRIKPDSELILTTSPLDFAQLDYRDLTTLSDVLIAVQVELTLSIVKVAV